MRSKDLNSIKDISRLSKTSENLELFNRICNVRNFEMNVKKAYDDGLMPKIPIYLSLGQESTTAALSIALPGAYKFGQHRCHDIYICWGGNLRSLRDELLGLPTGCAGGMGGSASIHSMEAKMFGHDGHMGTQIPIAGGYAQGTGHPTIAIMGDASAEEGFVLGDMGKVASQKDPVLFVCYDNGLSIKTEVSVRRSWEIVDVAKAFNMPAVDIADNPWVVMHYAKVFKNNLPALINVRLCRELWHAGTGCDGPPEWNRYELIKNEMTLLGLEKQVEEIEKSSKKYIDSIWDERSRP